MGGGGFAGSGLSLKLLVHATDASERVDTSGLPFVPGVGLLIALGDPLLTTSASHPVRYLSPHESEGLLKRSQYHLSNG